MLRNAVKGISARSHCQQWQRRTCGRGPSQKDRWHSPKEGRPDRKGVGDLDKGWGALRVSSRDGVAPRENPQSPSYHRPGKRRQNQVVGPEASSRCGSSPDWIARITIRYSNSLAAPSAAGWLLSLLYLLHLLRVSLLQLLRLLRVLLLHLLRSLRCSPLFG